MGNPFTSVSVSSYNSNPPSDDGQQTSSNRISWAGIKSKLSDPIKTAFDNLVSALVTSFGKVAGGVTKVTDNYTILASDQGKLVVLESGSNKTFTLPAAATVGSPFMFQVLNLSTSSLTLDPPGSETIDGDATLAVLSGGGLTIQTDGANWFTAGQNYVDRSPITLPEGYLTPTSGTPVIAGDVSAATAVYYTPYTGNHVPISDGTDFAMYEFAELTLTLNSNHVSGAIYDVFVFNDSGTIRVGTGPAWNTATAGSGARGSGAGTTELTRYKGILVNNVSMTARNGAATYTVAAKAGTYVGSIAVDSSAGHVTCHRSYGQSRKWGVWNYYNRQRIVLKVGDGTASWTYNSATIRSSNGAAENTAAAFCGIAEEYVKASFQQFVGTNAGNDIFKIGVGLNSTTAFTGTVGMFDGADAMAVGGMVVASYALTPSLGVNNFNCCEQGTAGQTIDDIKGTESYMLMSVEWMG